MSSQRTKRVPQKRKLNDFDETKNSRDYYSKTTLNNNKNENTSICNTLSINNSNDNNNNHSVVVEICEIVNNLSSNYNSFSQQFTNSLSRINQLISSLSSSSSSSSSGGSFNNNDNSDSSSCDSTYHTQTSFSENNLSSSSSSSAIIEKSKRFKYHHSDTSQIYIFQKLDSSYQDLCSVLNSYISSTSSSSSSSSSSASTKTSSDISRKTASRKKKGDYDGDDDNNKNNNNMELEAKKCNLTFIRVSCIEDIPTNDPNLIVIYPFILTTPRIKELLDLKLIKEIKKYCKKIYAVAILVSLKKSSELQSYELEDASDACGLDEIFQLHLDSFSKDSATGKSIIPLKENIELFDIIIKKL